MIVGVVILVAALGLAGLAVFGWVRAQFAAPGPAAAPAVLVIPKGAGLDRIAHVLAEAGVIDSPLVFEAGVRLAGAATALKAGEYEFPARASPRDVMDILRAGKTVQHKFTVAEGLTTAQVLSQLRAFGVLSGTVTEEPGEGELLPDTYYFSREETYDQAIARMRAAMRETLEALWRARAPGLPYRNKREALILASIIEKETALDAERRRIAAVFVNRLRRGMRLQSDPTVIYALTGGRGPLARALTTRDLETPSPYNTYLHRGLPPGPIANPGRASIAAALDPLPTKDLYFVADGTGGHAFAETLAEHARNVARWRKLRR